MPTPPRPFDDEGDHSSAQHGTFDDERHDERHDEHRDERSDHDRQPNYWFRRAVAIGGVVAVIATAAVVIANLIGTGGDESVTGSAPVDWNRIVTFDARTGIVVVDDDAGEQLSRIDSGLRGLTDADVSGSTALATSDDSATVVDLTGSEQDDGDETVVPVGAVGTARPSGSDLTLVAPATASSRGVLVHGPSGDRIDTDEFAPVAGARYEFGNARSDPSGRHVLVTDSGNFQSVLFSFDRDEPSFFPGLALAVDADTVVTAQNVGNDATVSVFDHAGEPLGSGRTASVRAALIAGDTVGLVTVDGRLVDLDESSGDTAEGTELDIGTVTEGHVTTTGDRLIVVGADGTAIVDDSGAVLGSFPGLFPRPPVQAAAPLGARCLSLGDDAGSELVLVDTNDATTLAEARAPGILHTSADGCTVVVAAAGGLDVITTDSVSRVDLAGTLVAVTPDASGVVIERDGRLLLTDLPTDAETEADSTSGIDIGPAGRLVSFTNG